MVRRWEGFERATTFLGALFWTHHEIVVRQDVRYEVLVFLATLLAGKEGLRVWVASRSGTSTVSDSPSSGSDGSPSPSSTV
jgi:hypothetical protein